MQKKTQAPSIHLSPSSQQKQNQKIMYGLQLGQQAMMQLSDSKLPLLISGRLIIKKKTVETSSSNLPMIIGLALGGLGLAACIGVIVYKVIQSKKKKQHKRLTQDENKVKKVKNKKKKR